MRTAICLLLALLGSGCVSFQWRNAQHPERDFDADWAECSQGRVHSNFAIIHCLRSKGWDAE